MKLDQERRMFLILNWLRILKICAGVLMLGVCISCVTPATKDEPPLNSRILAENSAIKKRLPLIERENDVLRKENHHHRTKIQDLESKILNLDSQLTVLGEKYDEDMASNSEQIKELHYAIQNLEKESTKKIKSLTASRYALKKKYIRKVEALNQQIVSQKASFQKERKQIMAENSKRESDLSNQIEKLDKSINTKETENASLKKANAALSRKLSEANDLANALRKTRDDFLAELQTVKATNLRLKKALNSQ